MFERLESGFDSVFGTELNPLYHLGALGWFFYWIVAASGVYLYIFFDSGVTQAYQSVEYLTHTQWYAGGVARSLHRYASDALVVVMLLHLLREYVMDRYRGPRWFTWVVGVAILWLVYASGITGYWIVWDKLAQYIAIASSEWLDVLPIFGQSIARNFLHESTLSGRFFTLMVFIHIAVPLILLFIMWIHLQRVTHPDVNPPKRLALMTLAMMLALSFAYPATSQGPADLGKIPSQVGLDWFYLALYPLLDIFSGQAVWWIAGIATLLLVLMPWMPSQKFSPAVVDLENCNGCGRCAVDCPFNAISMQPRSDQSGYRQEAVVRDDLCLACGICVGSCPTATPFRRRSALAAGIDLPDMDVAGLRERVLDVTAGMEGRGVLIIGCESGLDLDEFRSDDVAVLVLRCIGHLPPPFIDFLLSRKLVEGVVLTGCRSGDCRHRLGIRWTRQRLDLERDPYLRKRVDRRRIARLWTGPDNSRVFHSRLEAFRGELADLETGDDGMSGEECDAP